MKIKDYRTEKSLSLRGFAALVNEKAPGEEPVTASMVQRWEAGALPRQDNRRRVEEATGGAVTKQDLHTASDQRGEKLPRRSSAASRSASLKAAMTRRRQKEARG